MNSITFAFALALLVVAVTSEPPKFIHIVQQDDVRDESGTYSHSFVSEDGTKFRETGKLIPNDEGNGNVVVKEGAYSFIATDGKTYDLKYVADEKGFQPTADYLPVAPTV